MTQIHIRPQGQGRFELIDWLRALAVTFVVFGHSATTVFPGGAIGVSVFFVLSGYLIASILLKDGMLEVGNIGKFIVRRVARIYPMYLIQIAAVLVFLAIYKPASAAQLLPNLWRLLTFTGGNDVWVGYGIGVLWTLKAEFWFYLTFPAFLWLAVGFGRVLTFLIVGIFLYALAETISLGSMTAISQYDHFLIGALAFAAIQSGTVPGFLKSRKCLFIGLAIVLVAASIKFPGYGHRGHLQSLCAACGTAMMLISAHWNPPTLRIPALAFIGRISYSIYLTHAVVLDAFYLKYDNQPVPNVILYLAIVLGVSVVTYYVIEQPMIRLAHRRVRFSAPTRIANA